MWNFSDLILNSIYLYLHHIFKSGVGTLKYLRMKEKKE